MKYIDLYILFVYKLSMNIDDNSSLITLTNNDLKELQDIYGTTYANVIKKYIKEYGELNYNNIVSFINESKKKYSISTVALYKAALKKLVKYNIKDITKRAYIDLAFNDIKISSQNKTIHKEKTISKKVVEDMIKFSNSRNKLVIWTLYKTGLRVSELIQIELKNCKEVQTGSTIYISISILGKGSKERKIKLEKVLFDKIREMFKGEVYLFETKNSTKFSRFAIYEIVKKAGIRALGTNQIHPHTLRHSFATKLLVEDRKSLKSVSLYLGHSSTAITSDFYIHDELTIEDIELL